MGFQFELKLRKDRLVKIQEVKRAVEQRASERYKKEKEEYDAKMEFISDSNWDSRAVIDQVAKDVSQSLPKQTLTGLLIDESGWVRKGDKSVGVGHQYCGNVGKTANSQVAVYGCLSNGKHVSLVDCRLYLPASWTTDSERCKEADIPVEERTFKTKQELAVEIIKRQ